MTWIERIKTDFTITTGDGREFVPGWINASKNIEYNVATFEFKELAGTLVRRGTPRGTRYNIDIIFQGPDHLDQAAAFEQSAADPRPWTIAHPLYGTLLVQPVGLVFDNTGHNVTRITGGIIETISTTPDIPVTSPADKIIEDKMATDAAFAQAYTDSVPLAKVKNVQQMIRNAAGAYNAYISELVTNDDVIAFQTAYNSANAAFRSSVTTTANAIAAAQSLISMPYRLQSDVATRLSMLTSLTRYLHTTVTSESTKAAKFLFEASTGVAISTMVAAAVTNTGRSYNNRRQALGVISTVLEAYESYLTTLDTLQSLTGGLPDSYIPSRGPLMALGNLVSYAVTSLLDIAASSRQERSFYLEHDSNIVQLASRLYGLKADDTTIDELMAANEFGLNEMLIVKKGRLITYYV